MPRSRQTTELELTATGNEQIEQALRDIGITGRDSFERLEKVSGQLNRQLVQLDRNSNRFQSAIKGVGREILAFGAGAVAFTSIAAAGAAATRQMISFETELANVGTLVGRGVDELDDYRQGLIDLDPNLGNTTQLAAGLYQTISAGIDGDPLEFLATSSQLAIAGLTDTALAVDVLSTITKGYGEEASGAARNADILFTAVRLGKTTVEELGQQLGSVIPLAATLGIGFEEVAAATAALTQGGLSTDRAATALRSAFNQLITQTEKFSEAGIDLQDVIGRRGLVGVLEELQRVTGGNSTQIRQFIQDSEGFVGVLALAGNQFDELQVAIEAATNAEGTSLKAFQIQTATTEGALRAFTGELDRLYQDVGPPVLNFLTAATRGVTDLLSAFRSGGDEPGALKDALATLRQIDEVLKDREQSGGQVGPRATGIFALSTEELRKRQAELKFEIELLKGISREAEDAGDAIGAASKAAGDNSAEALRRTVAFNDDIQKQLLEITDSTAATVAEIEQQNKVRLQRAERVGGDIAEVEKLNAALIAEAHEAGLKRQAQATERANRDRLSQEERVQRQFLSIRTAANRQQVREEEERQRESDRLSQGALQFKLDLIKEEARAYAEHQEALIDLEVRRIKEQEKVNREAFERIAEAREEQIERERVQAEETAEQVADVIGRALFEGEGAGGIAQALKDGVREALEDDLFKDLYKELSDGLSNIFSGSTNAFQLPDGVQGPVQPEAESIGGRLAQRFSTSGVGQALGSAGQGVGTAGFLQGLFSGGDFRNTPFGELFGFTGNDIAQNTLGGIANGATAGSQFGPFGALIGGGIGGLVGGLTAAFGDEKNSTARIVNNGALPFGAIEDAAVARGAFGSISFLDDGTKRFGAGQATQSIAAIDDEIAALLTDRQEELAQAAIDATPLQVTTSGNSGDVLAEVIGDRFTRILDGIQGAGTTADIFGEDFEVNASNLESVSQTFNEIFEVLGAIDRIENPTEPLTASRIAINAINDEFDALEEAAIRFGFETEGLARGRQEALQKLTDDFNEEISRELLGLTDPFAAAVENLAEIQEDRLREARDAGADQNEIIRLNLIEQNNLVQSFYDQQLDGIRSQFGQITALVDSLDTFTDAERRFRGIAESFGELTDAANELGLPVEEVTAAFERAVQGITDDFNRDVERRILAFTDPFELAIRNLFDTQANEFREAQAAGASLSQVLNLQRLEQEALFESFATGVNGFGGAISAFLQDLGISEQGGLGISTRLDNARLAFEGALAGTDENAAVQAAGTFLDLLRETFGSTSGFFEEREGIIQALDNFRSGAGVVGEENDFEAFLARFESIQVQQNNEQFGGLRDAIDQQRRAEIEKLTEQVDLQRETLNAVNVVTEQVERQVEVATRIELSNSAIANSTLRNSDTVQRILEIEVAKLAERTVS